MTFSVIVPVYNVEKYLARCLDSILNQTCADFEIIVVNDGSPDNSQKIIDEYAANYPDKLKAFTKENGGLSDARNFGVAKASGDYILFVDSDDYIHKDTLSLLKKEIENSSADVIGFNLAVVNDEGVKIDIMSKPQFSSLSGQEAIISLVNSKKSFEAACGFAYKAKFWRQQNFSFIKGIYHEDFALIPLVILLANKVSCIDADIYFYVNTDNSITRTQTDDRKRRLANDLLCGLDFLISQCIAHKLEKTYAGRMYLSYVVNAAIYRLQSLDGELKNDFRIELKKRKISKYIIDDTLKRKIRKLLLRIKNRI